MEVTGLSHFTLQLLHKEKLGQERQSRRGKQGELQNKPLTDSKRSRVSKSPRFAGWLGAGRVHRACAPRAAGGLEELLRMRTFLPIIALKPTPELPYARCPTLLKNPGIF